MANDLNKGADSLLARIAEEAKGAAEQTAESAQTEINRIKELAQRDVSVAKQDAQTAKGKHQLFAVHAVGTETEPDQRQRCQHDDVGLRAAQEQFHQCLRA